MQKCKRTGITKTTLKMNTVKGLILPDSKIYKAIVSKTGGKDGQSDQQKKMKIPEIDPH
jgi:hypothetical protein